MRHTPLHLRLSGAASHLCCQDLQENKAAKKQCGGVRPQNSLTSIVSKTTLKNVVQMTISFAKCGGKSVHSVTVLL